MFFSVFWTVYIPVVTIILFCDRRVADPFLPPTPRARIACPFQSAAN